MHGSLRLSCISLSGALSACASLPDATLQYQLAKSEITVNVSRVIACNDQDFLIDSVAATPKVEYFAAGKSKTISLKFLKSVFSDQDVKIDRFDDGRLKAINASFQGQGEAAIKAIATLVGSVLLLAKADGSTAALKDAAKCRQINDLAGGKGKPLALNYQGVIKPSKGDKSATLEAVGTSKAAVEAIDPVGTFLFPMSARIEAEGNTTIPQPIIFGGVEIFDEDSNEVELKGATTLVLRQPRAETLVVSIKTNEFWRGQVSIPEHGVYYRMPLMKPRLFGKEVLSASFAESGALTSVQYATSSAAAQTFNSANALFDAVRRTDEEKAAALKAEADVLAQQQRIVGCQADPKNCK